MQIAPDGTILDDNGNPVAAQGGFDIRGVPAPAPVSTGRTAPVGLGTAAPMPAAPPLQQFAPPAPAAAPRQPAPPSGSPKTPGAGARRPTADDPIAQQKALQGRAAELIGRSTDLAKGKAEDAVGPANSIAATEADHAATVARVQQQASAEIQQRQAKVDAAMEKYQGAQFRDFWADKPTGNKVLAHISMAVGAFASSITRGPNTAMQVVESAIERDYQRQRDTIAKMRDDIAMAKAGVQDAREAKADLLTDAQVKKIATIDAAKAEAERLLKLRGVPEAEIAGNAAILKLEQDGLKEREELKTGIAQRAQIRAQTALAYANAAHARTSAAGVASQRFNAGLGIFGQDGQPIGSTGDPKRDEEIRRVGGNFSTFDGLMSQLRQSYETDGRVLPGSDAAQKRAAIVAQLTLAVKNNEDLGALVGQDWKVIEDQVGKGVGMYIVNPVAKIQQTQDIARQKFATKINTIAGPMGQQITGAFVGGGQGGAPQPQGVRQTRTLKNGQTVTGMLLPDGSFEVDG